MDYNDPKVRQAGEVVQSFMAISRVLTKFTSQNAESLGLTLQQLGILNTISASPEITLKDSLSVATEYRSCNLSGGNPVW